MYRHSHLRQEIGRRSKGSSHGRRSTPENDLLQPAQELKTTIVYERNVVREVHTSSLTFVVPFSIALGGALLINYDLIMRSIITFSLDV
jgi:hypothetical protein